MYKWAYYTWADVKNYISPIVELQTMDTLMLSTIRVMEILSPILLSIGKFYVVSSSWWLLSQISTMSFTWLTLAISTWLQFSGSFGTFVKHELMDSLSLLIPTSRFIPIMMLSGLDALIHVSLLPGIMLVNVSWQLFDLPWKCNMVRVSKSSIKAEYRAMSFACSEIILASRSSIGLGFLQHQATPLHVYNY